MASSDPPTRDPDLELPIPEVWRPVFAAIVSSLARGDFRPMDIPGMRRVSPEIAAQMASYVEQYGAQPVELAGLTWAYSVYRWRPRLGRWDVLVNLETIEEGLSDLTLSATVYELESGYQFAVEGIYVP